MQVQTTDRGGTDGILSAIQSLPMETFTIRDVRAVRPGAANSSLYAAIKAAKDAGLIEKAGVAFPDPGGPGMTSYRIKEHSSNPEAAEDPPLAEESAPPKARNTAARVREIVATLEPETEFYVGEIIKRAPELSYPAVKSQLEVLSKRGVLRTVANDRAGNIIRTRYRVENLSLLEKKEPVRLPMSEPSSEPLAPNENLSARVREHLRNLEEGTEFAATDIASRIPGADVSAVSSAIAYASKRGMVAVLGRRKGANARYTTRYRIADLSVQINSSAEAHGGSAPGRKERGRMRRKLPVLSDDVQAGGPPVIETTPPLDEPAPAPAVPEWPWARLTPATLSQQLLDLAALAEGLKPDLSKATDEELMAELHRRISLKKE